MTNTDVFGAGVKDVGLPVGQGRKWWWGGFEIQHSNFSVQVHLRPFLHIFVSWVFFFLGQQVILAVSMSAGKNTVGSRSV